VGSASTAPGYTGSIGSGYRGSQGDKGYTGSTSDIPGYTGSAGSGYAGSRGYVGSASDIPGYTGSAGSGYAGSRGDKGYTGSFGTGYTGSVGSGYVGSASDIPGYTGSQGNIGLIGYTGSVGAGYTGSASTVPGYTGSASGPRGYTGSSSSVFVVAMSDETTPLTVGLGKTRFRAPFNMCLTQLPKASLTVASISGNVVLDIRVSPATGNIYGNITSIFKSNLGLTIDQGTVSTLANITGNRGQLGNATSSTVRINSDDEIIFDIIAPGSGAAGLKTTLYYTVI
jgi:hypothetical protein